MTNEMSRYGQGNGGPLQAAAPGRSSSGLIDVLDRVLDKGVVIAGDIKINLLDIELLTIKVRLLIASADKAKEMGIDWWAHDPELSSRSRGQQQRLESDKENKALRERVGQLESKLDALTDLLDRRLPEPAPRRAKGG
jgi:Gas vesicle protein